MPDEASLVPLFVVSRVTQPATGDESSFITGQWLSSNGGLIMW